MVIGWVAMLLFAFHACTHMVAAGDTWVAMACGRHFVNHGVNTVEPFSANSHKPGPTPEEVATWPAWARWITDKVGLDTVRHWHPTGWVNQNWLTHVIFYKLTTTLGSVSDPYYNALVYWKFSLYFLAAVTLYGTARIYGVNRALGVIAVCFALFIGRSFFDIRPAGFSNLLTAVLILIFALASYRNILYIWLIVPLIIFWSNVHGGYIYAFIVLVPFVAWHALMNLPRRWLVAAYGIVLWLVLYGLVRQFRSHEFLKPIPLRADGTFYLLVLAIGGSIALTVRHRVTHGPIVAYHTLVSCVLFVILLLARFFPVLPAQLSSQERAEFQIHTTGAMLSYLGIFTVAMVVGAVVVALKEKVVQAMNVRGIVHVVAAGFVAFVAMVIFNPFHLTNLTHTFVISVSKHAERWRDVHEWHRAFDWTNPVGTAVPFAVMYALAWLVLLVWGIIHVYMSRIVNAPVPRKVKASGDYAWPKLDFSLLLITAMTIYMAIRSRRFIPIAGFAACPVIAILIDHTVRIVAATTQTVSQGRFEVPAIPPLWRLALSIAGGGLVLVFGLWCGARFYRVYLDYWPADTKYTSVFMRMTASDAKPFAACEFIRKNKLSGKMFNYWTEGGFIAWGQDPDPRTGRTPLQLFMDGRAQAAYDRKTFDLWTNIIYGGPSATPALREGRKPTRNESIEIGQWVNEQLKKHNVWVVLMPTSQFDTPFTNGLEYNPDWRILYMDDRQRLFVDITTPTGEQLFHGMLTGKTIYPDEYSRKLTTGHNLLLLQNPVQKKKGLELLIEALEENFAPAPLLEMLLIGTQFPDLRSRIDEMCHRYAQDFAKKIQEYAGRDGFNTRLEAIRLVMIRLQQTALAGQNKELAEVYDRQIDAYERQRTAILSKKRW